jgi:hypothetical protein
MDYTVEAGSSSHSEYFRPYPESYGAKRNLYASDLISARNTDFDGPMNPAVLPRSYRGAGQTVYDLSEANSALRLTPLRLSDTIRGKEDKR